MPRLPHPTKGKPAEHISALSRARGLADPLAYHMQGHSSGLEPAVTSLNATYRELAGIQSPHQNGAVDEAHSAPQRTVIMTVKGLGADGTVHTPLAQGVLTYS
jgi:hypothetical protein